MSRKVKFKVKKGKFKVKLKSGDDSLPLGEGDIRGLLVLGMASALAPGASVAPQKLLAGPDAPAMLPAGDTGEQESSE